MNGPKRCRSHCTNRVVDLVRAGVGQVLALEPDLCAALARREVLELEDRGGPADVVLPETGELGDEPLLRIFGNRLFFFLGLGRGGSFEP